MESSPKKNIEVIARNANVRQLHRTITTHTYEVTASKAATLRDNTVYFPGWEAQQDGVPVAIQYQDPNNRGIITFPTFAGTHVISVSYRETKLRIIADILSIFGMILIITLLLINQITKYVSLRYNEHNK